MTGNIIPIIVFIGVIINLQFSWLQFSQVSLSSWSSWSSKFSYFYEKYQLSQVVYSFLKKLRFLLCRFTIVPFGNSYHLLSLFTLFIHSLKNASSFHLVRTENNFRFAEFQKNLEKIFPPYRCTRGGGRGGGG